MLARFGLAGGGLAVIGLIIVLIMAGNGTFGDSKGGPGIFADEEEPPAEGPPLAQMCPPPTAVPDDKYAEPPPPPPGPRTVDEEAGISYAAYGDPWEPWTDDWSGGDLEVHYRVGQHFITETYSGGTYHASILSGSVPATVNDGFTLNLTCVGQQVVADVRRSYYPQPNRSEEIRSEETTLGGRRAWVSVFRLHFSEPGLKAKDELVGVAVIDVGRIEAAVLYVSIPGTHRQYDYVVEEVIESVRPVE